MPRVFAGEIGPPPVIVQTQTLVAWIRGSLKVALPPPFVVPALPPNVACAMSDHLQVVAQVLPLTPWVLAGSPGVLPTFAATRLMKPEPRYWTPSLTL